MNEQLKTICEMTESQIDQAVVDYIEAHGHSPIQEFAPDRAWLEGAAYVRSQLVLITGNDQPKPSNDLISIRQPANRKEALWLLKLAETLITDINKTLDHALPTANDQEHINTVLSREVIRTIFMKHGFTVKDGQTDLKDYVYLAADDLIQTATLEVLKLTNFNLQSIADSEIVEFAVKEQLISFNDPDEDFLQVVRSVIDNLVRPLLQRMAKP